MIEITADDFSIDQVISQTRIEGSEADATRSTDSGHTRVEKHTRQLRRDR